MQNIAGCSMDPDLVASRRKVQETIHQFLLNRQSNQVGDFRQKFADIAKKLEERIFKDAASKEDYMSLTAPRINQQMHAIFSKMRSNNQQSSHHISSSSSISTMMPTPGMAHSGSGLHSVAPVDNVMINNINGASGIMVQQTTNATNLLPTANSSLGAVNNSPFNASSGPNYAHGYQQSPVNLVHVSGGNSNMMQPTGMSHESSQMIPTPGLNNNNNQHPMSTNSELSSRGHGGGFSNIDTVMLPQQQSQQQKQQYGQNSRILQSLGGQRGIGMRSNMQQNISTFELPDGVSDGSSIGLIGSSNMQAVTRLEAQDGNLSTASFVTSSKPLQQHFDRQHQQQNIPTSLSQQQLLPMASHGYSGGNIYGSRSSFPSTLNNNHQRINSMNLHAKPKTNHAVLTHHNSNMQSSQQQQPSLIKSQLFDSSQQHMNFQTSQTPQEHQMHSQNQVQNFQQHQQFQQQLQLKQRQQQHQHIQNQQQLIPKNEILRQTSMSSNFGGRSIQDHYYHNQSVESRKESLVPQPTQQLYLSEAENQYRHINNSSNNNNNNSTTTLFKDNTQFLNQFPNSSQEFQTSYSQSSQYMLHEQQQAAEAQSDFSCLLSASHPDASLMQQQNNSQMADKLLSDRQQSVGDFDQKRINNNGHVQFEAQPPPPLISSDGSLPAVNVFALQTDAVPQHSLKGHENSKRSIQYFKQKKWLLFLLHSRKCSDSSCTKNYCSVIQDLWLHWKKCKPGQQCRRPRCSELKRLLDHFQHCRALACPLCAPVREFIDSHRKTVEIRSAESWKAIGTGKTIADNNLISDINDTSSIEFTTSAVTQLSPKRLKLQPSFPSIVPKRETSPVSIPHMNLLLNASLDKEIPMSQKSGLITRFKPEPSDEVKIDSSSGGHPPSFGDLTKNDDHSKIIQVKRRDTAEELVVDENDGHTKQETIVLEKDKNQVAKIEIKQEANILQADPTAGSKSGKPKIKGVSLTELFTPEQINDHIFSLRQWVGQSKAKAEKNQAMERSMSENSCQLCAVEKLTFEPPPIYCTPCGARIKRNAMYYTMGTGDTRHYFCIPCYNEARGDTIQVDGSAYPKARLEKKRNDEETEEWWVQCDKCEAWQHQICALFNGRRNDGGQAEYTCPNCYVVEVKTGERKPLPQSAVLGAKDLPRTILSDHIEQRLFRRLKQEKQERARHLGKSYDEIPGADSLVVRVVSSVDKKLEVKQRFLEIFQEENYPTEFPYKSKVVLLFQNIEGVEVCLFGMYVQEFGSECQFPNQRRVYLSYLDSVKYFRPDIKTVTGEALRTFVYHEILIAYLEYCKKRGFTSCYIWACPPLKGEDYILYCHPEIQKTPKSDKLREWYLAMLRKAAKENIVVELTNLYDHFFTSIGECKSKVTAVRLPYFDGDYWPGAAEDMINQLRQEEDGRKLQKKGKTKKLITKRALKAAGQSDLSGNASKDALLMQKLGETILPMKEDFIMVHLQHSCTHCCLLMVSGTRWVCYKCKNFQLCEKCYDAEQRLDERERHPVNNREKHDLCPVEIGDVPPDTKDKDEILESEFFDTRQAFLSLCQGNHYQYDTLRRAKHSSMMVLYHLHNPTAPAFVTTCNVCHHDVEAGQGWRCEICPDFDVCNGCYQKDGGVDHHHKLTNYPTTAERDAQNQEARQKRVVQLRKMLELLVHASQCRFPHCQYPNCRKVKGLFRHGMQCKTRASGGCLLCKKMWYLLQLHARACKESECHVPRCKDLKEHLKRLQQQSDSRRRAAVMEMMRQRAAEVAGGTD